jgi:RNA polymerase sigma-70 factor (ECF subfamily)
LSEHESAPRDPRIAAAAAGDREAAHALLLELVPRVRNLVRYLARGDGEVDDMAQLVLVEITRSLATYRYEGSLNAWADRITVRRALRYLRERRAERGKLLSASFELSTVVSPGERPDHYAERRRLVQCLDRLPREQREVIVLHHVVGLSMPELAEELQVPFETARSRLRLGMRKLRDEIGEGTS